MPKYDVVRLDKFNQEVATIRTGLSKKDAEQVVRDAKRIMGSKFKMKGKNSNPFEDEAGDYEATYMKDGVFTKINLFFSSFKLASKWAKQQAKRYGDVTVYRETPSRVYMATWDSRGNRKNPERGNGTGRGNPSWLPDANWAVKDTNGRWHLVYSNEYPKTSGGYGFDVSYADGPHPRKVAQAIVNKNNKHGNPQPFFHHPYSVQTEGRTVITTVPDKKSAMAYARLYANTHKEPIQVVWQTADGGFRNAWARPRKGNPGIADEISEGFHGRKVSERFEVEEEELYPDNLAVLGCLVELSIISGSGVIPIRGFKNPYSPGYRKGDEVYLAAADRNNLEFVGGDQEIVNADKIAQHTNKTLVKLGKVKSIVYLADKHHLVGSNGKEEEYEHDFGKKRYFLFGKQVGQPELLYDCLNKTMKLVGGTYTITDEGIRD